MEHGDRDLATRTWPDVAGSPVLLVPVGATEQHGPHLPLGTDTMVAEELCRRAAGRVPGLLVTPPLAITASGEHQGFPGTLSIGTAAMTTVVVELVRSADWSGGVVLVNGHGGNHAAVTVAVQRLTAEGRRVHAWWPNVADGDLHAGHAETSIILALAPDVVRGDRAVAGPVPSIDALRADGLAAHSPTGVLGDPTRADAASGRALLAALEDYLARTIATVTARWRGTDDR